MEDKVFNKFRARLVKEGWLKSGVSGLIIGFTALLISSSVCWFVGFKAVWICAIIFATVTAIAVPVFYFTLFRPTEKALARRMDGLGLEERVITMKELAGNNSFIATRQRADAVSAIAKVDVKLIKIAVSIPLVIGLGVAAAFGSGMTVISALAANDVISSGGEIFVDNPKGVKTYEVIYDIEGEGYIEGDIVQLIDEGEDGLEVQAIPEEGFYFAGWIGSYIGADGYEYEIEDLEGFDNPVRQEVSVNRDMTIVAVFEKAEDGDGDGDGDGEGDSSGEGDADSKGPLSEGDSDSNGNSSMAPPNGDGNSSGGNYDDSGNQIIDGETYYGGDTYDNAYNDAMGSMGDGDGDKGSIGNYFDIIKD